LRFVEGELVLRLQHAPDDALLTILNRDFADIVAKGEIEAIGVTKVEAADHDFPELARIRFRFNRKGWARLLMMIDALNLPYLGEGRLPPSPAPPSATGFG